MTGQSDLGCPCHIIELHVHAIGEDAVMRQDPWIIGWMDFGNLQR